MLPVKFCKGHGFPTWNCSEPGTLMCHALQPAPSQWSVWGLMLIVPTLFIDIFTELEIPLLFFCCFLCCVLTAIFEYHK